jgi:hypothetical protein
MGAETVPYVPKMYSAKDPSKHVWISEMNRIPELRNPTPYIIVIVPGSSAITYRTHFRHNTIVVLSKVNTDLIIT